MAPLSTYEPKNRPAKRKWGINLPSVRAKAPEPQAPAPKRPQPQATGKARKPGTYYDQHHDTVLAKVHRKRKRLQAAKHSAKAEEARSQLPEAGGDGPAPAPVINDKEIRPASEPEPA